MNWRVAGCRVRRQVPGAWSHGVLMVAAYAMEPEVDCGMPQFDLSSKGSGVAEALSA